MAGYRIIVRGVVQGVGFRPCVKRLADRLQINGVVRNTSDGVVIELDGKAEEFIAALRREAPPLARIEECLVGEVSGNGAGLTDRVVQLIGLITVLSLAPSIVIMTTSFVRIVVVLSLLRTALGLQQSPAGASGNPAATAPDHVFNIEFASWTGVDAFLDFRL